jgi:hypothetical protein
MAADHIEAAENVSDMADHGPSAGRQMFDDIIDELADHPLCLLGSGLLMGFLLGHFVASHRSGRRWR